MEENKIYRLQVNLDQSQKDQLQQLAQRYGTIDMNGKMNPTYTIRAMISTAHKKEFPDYIQAIKARPDPKQREMNKIIAKEDREEFKEKRRIQKLESICLLMDDATLVPHPETNRPACRYPVFTTDSPHKVSKTYFTEELDLLTDETPALQYHGLYNEIGAEGKAKVMNIITNVMGTTPDQL